MIKRRPRDGFAARPLSQDPAYVPGLVDGLAQLYRHLSGRRRWQLVGVVLLMLAGAVAELATLGALLPFLALIADPDKATSHPALQALFSSFGVVDRPQLLRAMTALFACVVVVAAAIRLLLAWVSQQYVLRVGHDLSVEVYRRTLHQPYAFHASHNTSELIASINKVQNVVFGMLLPLMHAVTGAVIATFILAALIAVDSRVALGAAILLGGMYAGVSLWSRRRLTRTSQIVAEAYTERLRSVQEGYGGIRDVIIDHSQPLHVARFGETDRRMIDAQAQQLFLGAAPRFVIEATGMIVIAFVALALSYQSGGFVAALPVLGVLALGAQRLLPLIQLIYSAWVALAGNRHNLADVLKILALPVADDTADGPPMSFVDELSLEDVSFRYSPEQGDVLKNFDLRIPKGARVGVVGKTGSGKSTLIDLIMGLLSPTSGVVRVDGVALTSENLKGWRSQIAHVPQAIFLADATIAENIAFGVPRRALDLERVRQAAAKAELGGYIDGLPNGLETMVGERGVRLSGGQRQRIGIARALYKNATVLVFDEATSALDTATETAVMEAIGALGRELTIILVAHRISTLASCDKIVRIEGGKVVAEGVPVAAR